jgi:putative sigma-54 modulation protein
MQTANVNPHVTVTGRHLAITAAIHDHALKRIEGLHLDYPRIIEAHVILEVAEKYRHRAEVVLVCSNHITLEASEESDDLYVSIDQTVDKIARQMRKYKTRLQRQHRPRGHESIRYVEEQVYSPESYEEPVGQTTTAAVPASNHHHAPEPPIIHTDKYPVKPMFLDEAMLQMEVSKQQFLVFHNARTEKVNVLYRRKKGDFGLIQPN